MHFAGNQVSEWPSSWPLYVILFLFMHWMNESWLARGGDFYWLQRAQVPKSTRSRRISLFSLRFLHFSLKIRSRNGTQCWLLPHIFISICALNEWISGAWPHPEFPSTGHPNFLPNEYKFLPLAGGWIADSFMRPNKSKDFNMSICISLWIVDTNQGQHFPVHRRNRSTSLTRW